MTQPTELQPHVPSLVIRHSVGVLRSQLGTALSNSFGVEHCAPSRFRLCRRELNKWLMVFRDKLAQGISREILCA